MAEFNAMDTAAFKGVWVFCEQREGQIQTISYQLLSEGRKLANDLGVELCGVVMGSELNEDYIKISSVCQISGCLPESQVCLSRMQSILSALTSRYRRQRWKE